MVHIHSRCKHSVWVLLIVGLVLFFSVIVNAERLYTFGKAQPIKLDTQAKQLCTYDGFCYAYNNKGYFEIWKDSVWQGNLTFAIKGTYQGTPIMQTVRDFDWTWSKLSDTQQQIEVEANNGNVNTTWKLNLVAKEFAPIKITHIVTNNLPNPITNAELFYIVEVNPVVNPYFDYTRNDGVIERYGFDQNVNWTNEIIDFNAYYARTNFSNFKFLFDDLINNNFQITRAYFGNLNGLNTRLPNAKGFVIGVTKENGAINSGQTIKTDPILTVDDLNDGRISFTNGVWFADSNTVLGVGHGAVIGSNYAWNRGILEFNLSGLASVSVADLNISVSTKSIINETCNFDLNSITTIMPSGISGRPSNGKDWNSTTFEKVVDNWFDNTVGVDANLTTSVVTSWNNNITAGRNYLTFRIGMDNEPSYTNDVDDACSVTLCDTDITTGNCSPGGVTNPFIVYTLAKIPDLNVLYPESGQTFNKSTVSTIDLNFYIQDSDTNAGGMLIDINYSTTQTEGSGTVIVDDQNMVNTIRCDTNNFVAGTNCRYLWTITGVANNTYYILAKVKDAHSNTDYNAGEGTFIITSGAPTSTCTNNGVNNDWVINEACHFLNQTINIGTGILYLGINGLLGLDNSFLLAKGINMIADATPEPRIQYANGGQIILNKG